MLPSIFGESLFDDWMGFPFRGFESDVDYKLYGKHAAHVMKTDLKEHDEGYELKVDLPGFKKDQIDLQLQNGYLTITASKGLDEEGKDKKGRIVHQERYEGSMTRSFYIGENVKEEDVLSRRRSQWPFLSVRPFRSKVNHDYSSAPQNAGRSSCRQSVDSLKSQNGNFRKSSHFGID